MKAIQQINIYSVVISRDSGTTTEIMTASGNRAVRQIIRAKHGFKRHKTKKLFGYSAKITLLGSFD